MKQTAIQAPAQKEDVPFALICTHIWIALLGLEELTGLQSLEEQQLTSLGYFLPVKHRPSNNIILGGPSAGCLS